MMNTRPAGWRQLVLPHFSSKKHVVPLALIRVLGVVVVPAQRITRTAPTGDARKSTADVVFANGKIYTANDKHPWAGAVAVKAGTLMEVGSAKDIAALVGARTRVVDLGGAFALPGFIDDRIHPAQPYLHEEGGARLFPESFEEKQIAEAVTAYLRKNPKAPYIVGEKWAVGLFPNGHPKKEWLDSLISDRLAVLCDETRHAATGRQGHHRLYRCVGKCAAVQGLSKDGTRGQSECRHVRVHPHERPGQRSRG
jgi:hypothetical protein